MAEDRCVANAQRQPADDSLKRKRSDRSQITRWVQRTLPNRLYGPDWTLCHADQRAHDAPCRVLSVKNPGRLSFKPHSAASLALLAASEDGDPGGVADDIEFRHRDLHADGAAVRGCPPTIQSRLIRARCGKAEERGEGSGCVRWRRMLVPPHRRPNYSGRLPPVKMESLSARSTLSVVDDCALTHSAGAAIMTVAIAAMNRLVLITLPPKVG